LIAPDIHIKDSMPIHVSDYTMFQIDPLTSCVIASPFPFVIASGAWQSHLMILSPLAGES
jgi:hypothetical protein